ncbi:GGDEF domain-containing protein [Nautilia sp.]
MRVFNIITRTSLATFNTTALLVFLILMYVCLIKCKQKILMIQLITYLVIITFISLQTVIAKYNVFLPVWIDFTVMSAYIATNRKIATLLSVYAFLSLTIIYISDLYEIDAFSFMTLLLSLFAFSLLGFLISIQLDKYDEENISQSKKLKKLAMIDELTQIFNRRAFFKLGEQMLYQSYATNKQTSIIMLDIDFFKRINDTYGHKAGDVVLKNFAQNVKKIIRKNDLFARIGGEEFAILLYDINNNEITNIAENILNRIRNTKIKLDGKNEISITVSMGVYTVKTDDTIQEALINADKALYKAKVSGRDKVIYFYPSIS